MKKALFTTVSLATLSLAHMALAEGMVSMIVNAPLSATGTVAGTRAGINVYLQSDAAQGAILWPPRWSAMASPLAG